MTKSELINKVKSTDWEFLNADTKYMTHNIHRYSGKFIPQIAGSAIELLTNKNEVVLDSYMGSGTTLLEAELRGRNSIGVDLNPLAVLISEVKTTVVKEEEISELYSMLIPYVKSLLSEGQISLFDADFDEELCLNKVPDNLWRLEDPWNKKWYQQDVLYQLMLIYSVIENIKSYKARNIAKVAFSDILRKSSNASSKYPNVMYDKNVKKKPLPAKPFLESLNHTIDCVMQMSGKLRNSSVYAKVLLKNNLDLPIENESVDAIISHPPYIAAVPYAEYGSLSLKWLGFDDKTLDEELTGGKRHSSNVVSRFAEDYKKYFIESYRVLKNRKYMFLMVGNPMVHGERVDLYAMTKEYAKEAGFEFITMAVRHGKNRRGNKMGDEYLLFFRK